MDSDWGRNSGQACSINILDPLGCLRWTNPDRPLPAQCRKSPQTDLHACLCRPGSFWDLWAWSSDWSPICGENAASRGTTLLLAGYDDPRRTYGTTELDIPFRRLLKSYRDADPPPKPQLALPVATGECAGTYHHAPNMVLTRATADLITTAFFFLLQIGEYAMPSANTHTWMVQFWVQDVTFCKTGFMLSNKLPLPQLFLTDSVTLYMDNQKNGQWGATIHHTMCPT